MNENKKQKWSILIALMISLCLTGGITYARAQEEKAVQRALAEEVFRFHVLANSDRAEDQRLKLRVRDAVINYMKESIPEGKDVEETKKWTKDHLMEIQKVAEQEIDRQGYAYAVTTEVTKSMFPEKSYGDVTFPAGLYEALRIEIGKGKGQNWWCVLYPNLCFLDSVRAVVPEEGKEQLKQVLTEEEYEEITEVKIKWFYLQICEGVCRIAGVDE